MRAGAVLFLWPLLTACHAPPKVMHADSSTALNAVRITVAGGERVVNDAALEADLVPLMAGLVAGDRLQAFVQLQANAPVAYETSWDWIGADGVVLGATRWTPAPLVAAPGEVRAEAVAPVDGAVAAVLYVRRRPQ